MKPAWRVDTALAVILAISALLAIRAPGAPDRDRVFGMDFGIPTQWYGSPSDFRPDCVGVPENSIGLDFLNIDRCLKSLGTETALYKRDCPCDPFRRPYTYPPLMTFLFLWVFWVSTAVSVKIWTTAVLTLILLNVYLWLGFWKADISVPRRLAACVLLTFSYPSLFSYQRGQQDVWLLFLMAACAVFLKHQRWFWLGAALAAAGLLKIYPAPLFVSLGLVFIFLPAARSFWAGGAVALALGVGLFFETTLYYVQHTLPLLSHLAFTKPNNVHSHSLTVALGGWGVACFALLWAAGMVILWQALKKKSADALPAFLFLAGLSVYLPRTSYDYNLILWIPVFAGYLSGREKTVDVIEWAGVTLLALGVFLPRWLQNLVWPDCPQSVFLWLQLGGMALWAGGYFCRHLPKRLQ